MISQVILSCSLLVALVHGYPSYADSIPNGHLVTNPNAPTESWPGVGHRNSQGGGPLNPFGNAFRRAGYQWTTALCQQDSDNDGLTNGQELGDPYCTWTPGSTPSSSNVTHPGVRNRRSRS